MKAIINFVKSQSVNDWIQMGIWTVGLIVLFSTMNVMMFLILFIAGCGFNE